jgi:hypothetical protein
LVELVPYNLLQYSEQFNQAIWTKSNATISANSTIAPDGTLTADSIIENSSLHTHLIWQIATLNATTYTYSVYVKAISGSSRNFGILFQTSQKGVLINPSNGSVVSYFGTTSADVTITSFANGWFRVSVTATTAAITEAMRIYLGSGTTWTAPYQGDGASGAYIWGAQLVQGTSALDYQATETRLNIPRLDYSLGSCPNILLEPQRTNLALRSEEFNDATWVKNAASVTANATTSPSGIANADTLTGDGSSAVHLIQQNASFTLNAAYSISFYVKKSTNNFAQIYTFNGTGGQFANFDINSGVVGTLGTTFGTAPTSSITSVGNGWYRCTMIFTAALTASSGFGIALVSSSTSARLEANTLTTSVFLWGAQLEAGAYPTSYIPTSSASVTRNQDVISRGNIFTNGLITASGGTWFVELRNNRVLTRDASTNGLLLGDATFVSFGLRIKTYGPNRLTISKVVAGTETAIYTTTTDAVKLAIKWNGATADVFQNGVKVVSATAFTPTAMESFATNLSVPLNINSMALFPTPLTDGEMSMLTSGVYTPALAYAQLGLVSESPACLDSSVNALL